MSPSHPTRARAYGLRIATPQGEVWHRHASLTSLAEDISLRLYRSTHRLDHSVDIGLWVPFTLLDAKGTLLTWIRRTPYQANHNHFGTTKRIRIEWQSYEAFDRNGRSLQLSHLLNLVDLPELLRERKAKRIVHGERGHGPILNIHKSRGGNGWFRGIQTAHEIRQNALVLPSAGEVPTRSARNSNNLPTRWSEFSRSSQRSWKEQTKKNKQWDR
ncbi:MAG: hypothetical protein ABIP34_08295 [Rhodoferax sp.]|uniref:hypothetical protein n=1 Tax=Rhodoferax sp. TaxID=50421 RepID=UPI0032656483